MTDRAVAKLQALVRIPTVSDRDPAASTPTSSTRSSTSSSASSRCSTSGSSSPASTPTACSSAGRAAPPDRPVVLMAHLDVVPVDEDAPWQHPAFGADIVDGADLGPRHPRRQGLPGRHLRGRRAAARAGLHPRPGRLALVRLRRGGLRRGGARRGRGAGTPRRTPVVRPRRGRRGRARGVPGRRAAGRGHRRHREGRHLAGADRRGPRRSRLDARRGWARRPGSPARSSGSRSTRSRPARRARPSS